MKINKIIHVFGKLYGLLPKKNKIYLFVLIFLTIGLSLIETAGISVIMPFISIASNPSLLQTGWYKRIFDLLGFVDSNKFITFFGIVIILFYLFRALYSVVHTYLINRYSQALYKYFSHKLFTVFLAISYKTYAQKNSAELMVIINGESRSVNNVILNILQLSSELFTIVFVYVLMLFLNWKMTLVLTGIILLLVLSFLFSLLRRTKAQGLKRFESDMWINRIMKETFGNFKFIKLKGNQRDILNDFDSSTAAFARSRVISNTLGALPKSILESLGFSLLVAAVIIILYLYRDSSRVIPIISMYALALYRILPAIHRMLVNINNIIYDHKSLEIVDESLGLPVEREGSSSINFKKSLRLENVSFAYPNGNEVLNNVSFEIQRGEKIAVTGESGSGKSTLVDIIIGIHKPLSGLIYLDAEVLSDENILSWRRRIGYIPQSIYLFDGTVAENVSFGSEPDNDRIRKALQKANVWDFLSQKEGIDTLVGEGGIQLSGGQQQRIGIARALYDDPDLLVLDEATSALDTETEAKIMDEIYNVSKDKTLIVIAHRLSTVERCNRRICLEKGRIVFHE
jgi:ATP-binding cassette subfamily B protein/ATP-binding cassette subfamily C protein